MRKDLSIRTRPEGGVTVVEVNGPVENATIEAFEEGLAAAVKSATTVVVDLSGMEMITSQGLGLLIKHTELIGGPDRFLIAGVQPRVRDIFQALGLDQFFVIAKSVDQAIALLAARAASEAE
ncbi:MAG: STAS domain-containing protein [Planctomycetes bacterium]|nr:STAS domain-containing protein [Planctomycetota bacterium]